jgi:hypothetical protein
MVFFTNSIEVYNNLMHILPESLFPWILNHFRTICTSWDSSYYQLMMTQNIPYKGYLSSKWWLMVIATIVTTTIASFYLYFGVQVYLTIIVPFITSGQFAFGFIGWRVQNTHRFEFWQGAFGDKSIQYKNDVDFHSWICPFYCGWVQNLETQTYLALVARDRKRHSVIEKIYKSEKYATIARTNKRIK